MPVDTAASCWFFFSMVFSVVELLQSLKTSHTLYVSANKGIYVHGPHDCLNSNTNQSHVQSFYSFELVGFTWFSLPDQSELIFSTAAELAFFLYSLCPSSVLSQLTYLFLVWNNQTTVPPLRYLRFQSGAYLSAQTSRNLWRHIWVHRVVFRGHRWLSRPFFPQIAIVGKVLQGSQESVRKLWFISLSHCEANDHPGLTLYILTLEIWVQRKM